MPELAEAASDRDRDLRADIESLVSAGPRCRRALIRLADSGDWRARVLALSALGRIVRDDPRTKRPFSVGRVLAGIPGLRRHVPSVGYRGRLVSRSLQNAAVDHSFIVRTAAALALGECRDPSLAPMLVAMQTDPFRPVRLAAAVALAVSGQQVPAACAAGFHTELTPDLMAEGVPTLDWLRFLAAAHASLVEEAAPRLGADSSPGAEEYGRWLAGPLESLGGGGASVEAARYDHELDLEYQLEKPFGPHDRADNLRQLDAFVALVANLDLPRGARVLDVGGGSGWVSELLARFGFRPVVIDLAKPLLRLARRRFDDRQLRAGVAAADMTALPFLGGSVDGAIAIDALHHVEDLGGVLREIRRVLVPGGQFLIGEPGEGHSESPKSLAEAREQGVRESEVHPLALAGLARRAGFDRVLILPRVPSRATLEVGDLRRAMKNPAESWPVRNDGRETRFDTLVLRSMLARPLLVLSAGRRTPDTRSPGLLQVEMRAALTRTLDAVTGEVELRNTGDTAWLADTPDGTGVVWLGLQLLSPDGRMLDRELSRTRLPSRVPPGGRCSVRVRAALPSGSGAFRLKLDLVAERVCWFEDRDSRPLHIDV